MSGDALERCPLHGRPLLDDVVFVRYGLFRQPVGWEQARDAGFAHAHFIVFGGRRTDDVFLRRVRYCADCRAAQRRWCADHIGFGLPLTPEQEEIELRRAYGLHRLPRTVPDGIDELLRQGRVEAALAALRRADPALSPATLGRYLGYRRAKAAIAAARAPAAADEPPSDPAVTHPTPNIPKASERP